MPINILMPALSPTMTEGTLAKWHVKEGDEVASGDVIAEIETDKATMEVEAVDEGRVGRILVDEGAEGVAVNNVIAVLLEEGEEESALDAIAVVAPTPAARHPVMDEGGGGGDGGTQPTSTSTGRHPFPDEGPGGGPKPQPTPTPKPNGGDSGRIFSSPLARRMAKQAGLDLAALTGSGPRGRIVKADVDAALAGGAPAKAAPPPVATPAPGAAAPAVIAPAGPGAKQLADLLGMAHRQEGLSNMRKTIARRLTEAKQTVPHFYLTVDCRIDELLKIRKEINSRFEDNKISVNDFVIRASAMALKQVPAANASWDDSGMVFYDHADISVAVATPSGLITPVIKQAENKGLAQISKEMKDLATRARDGKLKPEEYQGGSFSVSNLGMFGIKEFAAIINPPQGCILAVGAGVQQPVVQNGEIAVATVMSCTLSVDHRVVDGAVGAQFLAAFKNLIEYPPTMLL